MKKLVFMIVALFMASVILAADKSKVANANIHTVKGMLSFAAGQVNKPYEKGAVGPDEFDEGGFVRYVYLQLGYELPTDAAGILSSGKAQKKAIKLEEGDVVFFQGEKKNSVGIFGIVYKMNANGTFDFIFASSEGVQIRNSQSLPFYRGVRITTDKEMKNLAKEYKKEQKALEKAKKEAEEAKDEAEEAAEKVKKAQKKAEKATEKARKKSAKVNQK